ncbi:hypothetical protein N7478_006781 [Penicillium angulare]|uniref:uncharacterized protein n=1 Tax=Penicillium angulare TaxID=116970 RepID=UPI002541CFB8|nr:uncharacterized protein N7478_006781 [Penicillium angulare]KAJ5281409.1 hypothetical protein N7478_006781 [Penicillium angulare]
MTTPENAYQELASVFSSRGNQILEIETISSTLGSPFLQDGLFVGVTKKMLVLAYTVARKLFIERLLPMSDDDFLMDSSQTEAQCTAVSNRVITETMLLFDCEHLNACNWRKRWLLAAVTRCAKTNTPDQIATTRQVLETELTLLKTYQCSPLHRHTKSPTLWMHRLWVLKQMFQIQPWSVQDLLDLQQEELTVVLRAAELHPKNYYAFSYMRKLYTLLVETGDVAERSDWAIRLAKCLIDPMRDWCLAHPRDISGWIFVVYLLERVPEQHIQTEVVRKVVLFARDIGWEGESLWTFVDQTVREFDLESILDRLLSSGISESGSSALVEDQGTLKPLPWQARLDRAKTYWAMNRKKQ